MKKITCQFIFTVAVILLTVAAKAQQTTAYSFEKKISLPGNGGYDYLFIDEQNRRLYVSHGTTVNVIDLNTEKLVGSIDKLKGCHGIAVAPGAGKGFITDGKANAIVAFNIHTLKIIKIIPISGKGPDAIIYDPYSNQVFAFNGDSDNASVIDVNNLKQTGTVSLGGGPEFAVADRHGKIYNNIEDKNNLNVIDSKTLKVIHTFPLSPCGGPTGVALDSVNKRLFTVCRQNKGMSVMDIASGKIVVTLPIGAGVDAVEYDAETKLIFCSNGDGATTIIHQETADKYSILQTLATQVRAKTLALDKTTHKIYLSVADFVPGTNNIVPGSFKVLVYKMNR